MKIDFSRHAQRRIAERNIPDPNAVRLAYCGQKLRKAIREKCKAKGTASGYIYLSHQRRFVYVCVQTDVAKYTLITAFDLKAD